MRRVSDDSDRCATIHALCESHAIIAAAREETRYPSTDRLDDAELLRRLCAFAEAEDLDAESPDCAADIATEATRLLRDALVTSLVEDHGLDDVVAGACRRRRIRGSEPPVAYCFIVLFQKADPARSRGGAPKRRTYALDILEPGFEQQLEHWVGVIATNVAASGVQYQDAFDEFHDLLEQTVLRRLIPIEDTDGRDDIADRTVQRLTEIIALSLPLDEMNLAAARRVRPRGNEYVFVRSLSDWVATSFYRAAGPPSQPLEPASFKHKRRRPFVVEDDESDEPGVTGGAPAAAQDDGVRELLARALKALALTRRLLADVVDEASNAPSWRDDRVLGDAVFKRYRPELDLVLKGLRAEKQQFGHMLTYVVMAMAENRKRHTVAILSLRAEWLESSVRDHISGRMRALLEDDAEPAALLILKTESAPQKYVPRNRARELRRLRTDPRYRAARLMSHATLLDTLPAVVGGSPAAIAAALPRAQSENSVKATRNQAATELGAVDQVLARCFRRYTMERHGLA